MTQAHGIIAIFGPTAIGKTEVAIELAGILRERGEEPVAVSADALQVYEGLDLLTAKPSEEQLAKLEHRLISFVPVNEPFNAYLYAREAHREIDGLLEAGSRPIVVGGTGLYLRAALAEMSMKPAGESSESQLWSSDTRCPTKLFGLTMEREALYRRIESRVDEMIAAGVRDEVLSAQKQGVSRTASKALGFEELSSDRDDGTAADATKKASRNYAKRQLTWMRKIPNVTLIDRTDLSAADVAQQIATDL